MVIPLNLKFVYYMGKNRFNLNDRSCSGLCKRDRQLYREQKKNKATIKYSRLEYRQEQRLAHHLHDRFLPPVKMNIKSALCHIFRI